MSTRLVQDIAAVVSLHSESEISFSSLLEDLSKSLSFQVDSDQVLQNLQYLRRGGLITVDWHKRLNKREAPINECMMKRVVSSEMWAQLLEDWLKIDQTLQERYGKVNPEIHDLLNTRQR